MKDPDNFELSEELTDKNSHMEFSFYRAYCRTEGNYLGQWNADRQVAINSKNHHLRSNSNHNVSIETR